MRNLTSRRHSFHRIILIAAIAGPALLAVSQSPASAAPGNLAAHHAAVPAPFPGGVKPGSAGITPARVKIMMDCSPLPRGDYVHTSSGDVSGHGWWLQNDCSATTAVVDVQLQEYYSDGSWRNKGNPGTGTVRPGGGSSARVTGRVTCGSSTTTGWRSMISVSTNGEFGLGFAYTNSQDISCRV